MSRVNTYFHELEKEMEEERYWNYTSKYKSALQAAENKDWDGVRFLLHRGYNTGYEEQLSILIGESGIKNLISLYIEKYPSYNEIARGGGYRDIVEWMIELGVNDYDRIADRAAYNAHRDIIELMIKKGAINYNRIATNAAYCGHKDIVGWMIRLGAINYNRIARYAVSGGYNELAQWLRSL